MFYDTYFSLLDMTLQTNKNNNFYIKNLYVLFKKNVNKKLFPP